MMLSDETRPEGSAAGRSACAGVTMATEWLWTKTGAGAVRMVCGNAAGQPLVVEAIVLESDVSRVKAHLTFYVGTDVAWEDRV
jgi:hypothetical protein